VKANEVSARVVQVLPVYQLNVTVPVAVPAPPLTLARSCTTVPTATAVTVAWTALWMAVVVVDDAVVTVSASQALVLPS
jgi:hypothetical protein